MLIHLQAKNNMATYPELLIVDAIGTILCRFNESIYKFLKLAYTLTAPINIQLF